jgi:copper resistance protein D
MPLAYWISVTVHVLAALFWLGGMFFLGVVGAPVLRAVEPPELRQRLFHAIGSRFRTAGWVAVAVLLATGVLNLHLRGLLRWGGLLADRTFWSTALGQALATKLAAVILMVGISAIHDFWLGPAAGRAVVGSPNAVRLRQQAALLARLNALIGVALVVAAVRLARGG